jgi:two-component system, sensor histidine kinase and response regulator
LDNPLHLLPLIALFLLIFPLNSEAGNDKTTQPLRVVGDNNSPPLLFLDADGEPRGYLIDLWQAWQEVTGRPVELQALNWHEAQRQFDQGEADILENIFLTPQRQLIYSFSKPYAHSAMAIYTHNTIHGILDIADLRGFRVGVIDSHACIDYLYRAGVTDLFISTNYETLTAAALRDEVKLFCIEEHPANYYLYRQQPQHPFNLAFVIDQVGVHRAVLLGKEALLKEIESGMSDIPAERHQALRYKWQLDKPFDYTPWVNHAITIGSVLLILILIMVLWNQMMRSAVRRKTEQLHDSSERFRALFEDTPQALLLLQDNYIIDANRAVVALLGYEQSHELIGHHPADLSPSYQADGKPSRAILDTRLNACSHGNCQRYEWQFQVLRGREITCEVILTPIRHAKTIRIHMVINDITDQKQTARELTLYRQHLEQLVEERTAQLATTSQNLAASAANLRQINEEQQTIFDLVSSAIVYLRHGTIQRCNHRLGEIFGSVTNSQIGQTPRYWFSDEQHYNEITAAMIESTMARGMFQAELQLVRQDGTPFWARMIAKPIDRGDLKSGSVITIDDIHQEHASVQAMQQAKRLAEEAARIKADFLANMSHEIRTPLNAITGLVHLAMKADPSPRMRDYLKKIQVSSQLLIGIINDILDFSRIEAGKLPIDTIAFSLRQLINQIESIITPAIEDKGLSLKISIDETIPDTLLGDPLRISQILLNFTNNAVKFTPQGEVEISVSQQNAGEQAIRITFSVSDTGIGIETQQQTRIFDSFHQGDSSTTRRFGGTGLGLTISRRLATLMGGEVGVISYPGAGSTFWLRLTLNHTSAPLVIDPPPVLTTIDRDKLSGLQILLVEDNEFNQEIAKELLEELNLNVTIAANGAIALQLIEQQSFDLILMDMQMPVMDGIAAASAIRQHHSASELPIIAMTANAMASDRQKCLDAGMNDYLAKPIDPCQLQTKLIQWLCHPPQP